MNLFSKHSRVLMILTAAVVIGGVNAVAASSVWRAEMDGEVVYLGGTCHMLRASDFPLPDEFDQAYAAADTLYFETDLAEMMAPAMQMRLLELGMLADGSSLADSLNEEAMQALTQHCAAKGLPLAAFSKMKPWMVAVTLTVLEWQQHGAVQDGVDAHFHAQAVAEGKPAHGLESIDEHLNFIASMGAGQESEMVLSMLQDLETMPQMVDALIAAWRKGDVATLDRDMIGDMREEFPEVYASLVSGRNEAWLPQILAMFEQPGVEYVLVGVGHFGGDDGLLALLRAKGVKIEPVEASTLTR